MYTLFWKIFVWFWLTVVIVGVTMVVTAVISPLNQSEQREARAKLSIYLPVEAKRAAETSELDGKTGLKNHFDGLRETAFFEPYLFDAAGNEVFDRNPGSRAVEFASAATEDTPRFSDHIGNGTFAAQQATGPSGRKYTILLIFSHVSFLALLNGLGFAAFARLLMLLFFGAILCCLLPPTIPPPLPPLRHVPPRI